MKFGDQRLDGPFGRRKAHQNKTFPLPFPKKIGSCGNQDGKRFWTRRVRLSVPPRWLSKALLALVRVCWWQPLNHQDHAVDEWRTKTSRQLLRDNFRFAAFDAGRGLQMALGVKRKWKKSKDGGKHNPGQPGRNGAQARKFMMSWRGSWSGHSEVRITPYRRSPARAPESAKRLSEMRTLTLLLGLVAAIQLHAADPRIGSRGRLVSAQSANWRSPSKISITALHDGVHVVASGEHPPRFHGEVGRTWNTSVPGNPGFQPNLSCAGSVRAGSRGQGEEGWSPGV